MTTVLETKRFVILTSQRSGSNFLEQTLNSNPRVRCYGEILLGFDGPAGRQRIPTILEKRPRPAVAASALLSGALMFPSRTIQRAYEEADEPVVGFRVMYNHASRSVLRSLENNDVSVIHLTRRNVLRQVISRLQMHRAHVSAGTYQTHRKGGTRLATKGVTRVSTSSEEIVKRVEELIARRNEAEHWLGRGRLPHLSISYEELLSEGQINNAAFQEVADFLGIEGSCEPSRLARTGSATLEDIVEDPIELRRLLETNGCGWMVDEW